MISEKSANNELQICQNARCSKNNLSDRKFWKKEIDHQYRIYIAALRAERDARYIIQEHSELLLQIEKAEITNIELRKEIRLLESELYVIYQRNAHDSVIIDGLQEADHDAKEINHVESQVRRRIDFATMEGNHEDVLNNMLKEEVSLLQRKKKEDAELITSFQPLLDQLKQTLAEEKMKNHQQGMKFKRELEATLKEYQKYNLDLEAIAAEKSSAIQWVMETLSSVLGSGMVVGRQEDGDETSSRGSSQETESFNVSSSDDIPDAEDLGDDFASMKKEYSEFVALKELLDSKNAVNIRVIYDCLQRYTDGLNTLVDEYLSCFEVETEIAFTKEYLQRLNLMRQKRDVAEVKNEVETTPRLDHMNLIYSCLLSEKEFLINMLLYFTSTLTEDFATHCVIQHKTEELFVHSLRSEDSD